MCIAVTCLLLTNGLCGSCSSIHIAARLMLVHLYQVATCRSCLPQWCHHTHMPPCLLHVWDRQCLPAWHKCTALLGGPCLLPVLFQSAQLGWCLPAWCMRPKRLEGVMPAAVVLHY